MQLKSIIETVSKEKKLSKEVVAQAVKSSLEKVASKKFPFGRVEADFDEDYLFRVLHFKTVVESEPEMLDEESEIDIQTAQDLYGPCEIGDEVGFEVTTELGRVDASLAKQVIGELFKAEESSIGYEQFKNQKGTIVSGMVQNVDKRGILVTLGAVEAYLPKSEMVKNERFHRNQPIEALLKDVSFDKGQLKMTLSRNSPQFVMEVIRQEVDEVRSGEVEIVSCVRSAGEKTKVVLDSETIQNPVAAAIGMRGHKIQKIMQRLGGERVDMCKYSDDLSVLLSGLLSQVKVRHVSETDTEIRCDVLQEDLGKAIGKEGINVRLASVILGKKVTVV